MNNSQVQVHKMFVILQLVHFIISQYKQQAIHVLDHCEHLFCIEESKPPRKPGTRKKLVYFRFTAAATSYANDKLFYDVFNIIHMSPAPISVYLPRERL